MREEERRVKKEDVLLLIPKNKQYIKYMLEIILKLPRVEKFSIGTEYKTVMYEMLENIMYLSKIGVEKWFPYLNKLDAQMNIQREFLRIMYENRWIDNKKFNTAINLIAEQGKILGGLIKFYGKYSKK